MISDAAARPATPNDRDRHFQADTGEIVVWNASTNNWDVETVGNGELVILDQDPPETYKYVASSNQLELIGASEPCCVYSVSGIDTLANIEAIAPATRAGNRYFVTDAGTERVIEYSADGTTYTDISDRTGSFQFEDISVSPSLTYVWSPGDQNYRLVSHWTYHPSRTYSSGIIQRDPVTGIEYTSQQGGNQGNPLSDTTWWQPTTQSTQEIIQEWFSDQLYGGHYAINQHRAIVANGYLYLAFANGPNHDAYITRCNLMTKVWDAPVMVAASALNDNDDHGNPAIAISPTGIIHLIFDSHGTNDWIYRRSTNPYDISTWETPNNLPGPKRGTYPQLHFLSDGTLIFFRRRSASVTHQHKATWGVNTSTNAGDTWESYVALLHGTDSQDPDETKYAQSYVLPNDKLAIVAAWHQCADDLVNVHQSIRRNAYYVTWDATNGIRDIQDNALTAPLTNAEADLGTNSAQVADFGLALSAANTAWPQDNLFLPLLLVNNANEPIVYYSQYTAANNIEAHIHTWDGAAWTDTIATTTPVSVLTDAGYADSNIELHSLLAQASGQYHLFTYDPTNANLVRFSATSLSGPWTQQETIFDISEKGERWNDLNPILGHTSDALMFFTDIETSTENGHGFVWGLNGLLNPSISTSTTQDEITIVDQGVIPDPSVYKAYVERVTNLFFVASGDRTSWTQVN